MVIDQFVAIEKTEDFYQDKKKKRRSRRPKPNSSLSACSSTTELNGEGPDCLGNGDTSNDAATSFGQSPLEQHGVVINSSSDHEETNTRDYDKGSSSKSCHLPKYCEEPVKSSSNKSILLQNERVIRRKLYSPHWSLEITNEAFEKGDAFRALFRVNAHNRIEAYCKIDGVPTDIFISGLPAQNRAVEGDVVAIQIDPPSMWNRMKGFVAHSADSTSLANLSLLSEVNEITNGACKGKIKVGPDSIFVPENMLTTNDSLFEEAPNCVNEAIDPISKLCAEITSVPHKRPTGKVVAIVEKSPRRNGVVGLLDIRQWLYDKLSYKNDTRRNNKNSCSLYEREYVHFTPNDLKFPTLMVSIKSLPGGIKERLENGDETVEMEIAAAKIDDWEQESHFPHAHVVRIFGRGGEIETHISAILFENMINTSSFSQESLSLIPNISWKVPNDELEHRRDLRSLCIFTIDPSTATDLDDALSITRLSKDIVRVGVHIADVSYFVVPESALDFEAKIRSTSVYMLQSKLPMLPPLLSENVGSLVPGEDRLAFSIFWDMNAAGNVVDRWIGRTVIRSCCKLSYEHAQAIIEGGLDLDNINNLGKDYPHLHGNFEWPDVIRCVKALNEVSKTLKKNRFNDGALRLESLKMVFIFDENGDLDDTMLSERKDSNFLVEEFMLLANRTAAEVISKAFPENALLRKHPEPETRRLRDLEMLYSKHGLELDTSSSARLHESLELIKAQLKDDNILFDILISYATKPMKLAEYFSTGELKGSEKEWGHYALAIPIYTHFTSPLRRYPDIIVHRTLAAVCEAEKNCLKNKKMFQKKCIFTGVSFDKNVAKSVEGREALTAAAVKHGISSTKMIAEVAAYCNNRKLASRNVKDSCDKLYMWALLKKKQILFSEARVLGIGPRFMSIYIYKLAIERRIYYDEVECLKAEYLDSTSTLVLSLSTRKSSFKRGIPSKFKSLDDVAMILSPCDLKSDMGFTGDETDASNDELSPRFFPLTVGLFSTIPVALHAVGGDNGPLEIGVRLYMSSYLRG